MDRPKIWKWIIETEQKQLPQYLIVSKDYTECTQKLRLLFREVYKHNIFREDLNWFGINDIGFVNNCYIPTLGDEDV